MPWRLRARDRSQRGGGERPKRACWWLHMGLEKAGRSVWLPGARRVPGWLPAEPARLPEREGLTPTAPWTGRPWSAPVGTERLLSQAGAAGPQPPAALEEGVGPPLQRWAQVPWAAPGHAVALSQSHDHHPLCCPPIQEPRDPGMSGVRPLPSAPQALVVSGQRHALKRPCPPRGPDLASPERPSSPIHIQETRSNTFPAQ